MPKITYEPPAKIRKGSKILLRITINTRNKRDVFCYFYAYASGEVVDINEDRSNIAIKLDEAFTDSKYLPTGPLVFRRNEDYEYECPTIKKPNRLETVDHEIV